MGTIRRAAVTGLFAAWLAPLTASADHASGRDAGGDLRAERPADPELEAVAEPDQQAASWEADSGPTAET
ncbi:hypothetical protein ACLF3G_06220 [Falsiroseomonas sp. HC035]|uniref:hypothetical protein n=1 Tax=Falsiroseomonas sp. HC035 TaxID=3390999 RepID=UPI003D323950